MRKSIKKLLPKSGRRDEIRRPDPISAKINSSLNKPFKQVTRMGKVLAVTGTIVNVAFSVYGLIPKKDHLPKTDVLRFEMMN